MIIENYLSGLSLGLLIAIPFGPVSLYCIQQTLYNNKLSTCFFIGLGAAIAHAFYGSIALLGLTHIQAFFYDYQQALQIAGGLLLCLMAYRNFHHTPSSKPLTSSSSAIHYTATTFALTLSNPITIAHFIALMSTQQQTSLGYDDLLIFVVGLMTGSISWRLLLGGISYTLTKKWPMGTLLQSFHQIGVWMIAAYGLRILLPALASSQLALAILAINR